MAENLLNSIIEGCVDLELITNWLLHQTAEKNDAYEGFQCSHEEFISYFLNTVHEEAPRYVNKPSGGDTPLKVKAKECVESEGVVRKRRSLFTSKTEAEGTNTLNKSNTFPPCNKSCSDVTSNSACSTPIRTPRHDSSHCSEISPLYRHQQSFTTPKTKNATVSTPKSRDLRLGDFIVSGKKSSSKARKGREGLDESDTKRNQRRRINPTSLKKISGGFQSAENSFDFLRDFEELPGESHRSVLAEERAKMVSCGVFKQITSTPRKFPVFSVSRSEIVPELSSVTCRETLDAFVTLYVTILENNFVRNLCSELYFLVSLLLSKQYECEVAGTQRKPFETIHNVIYFCVKVLERQLRVLELLDRVTLKLLVDHTNVRTFSTILTPDILVPVEHKPIPENAFDSHANVCFISDTDNRGNFPNDETFHAFRKQRDVFYEILRLWEKNRMRSDWCFNSALSGKMKALMALSSDPVNMVHLARLFKAQLLSGCGKGGVEAGPEDFEFLASIPNLNREKINRLRTRLVTKHSDGGVNERPAFTEEQEFYRDFVLAASYVFLRHLSDCFVSEIVELNDSKFAQLEDSETIDEVTKQSFLQTLNSLRVLAKFLGFLESLPYKSEHPPVNLITEQIKIREQCRPSLDLSTIVQNAIKRGTLVLTIPWVTKYLAMLDSVTLQLPFYASVFQLLFSIHRNCTSPNFPSFESLIMVRLSLGWLFEQPHFPENFYRTDKRTEMTFNRNFTLDSLRIVDQRVVHSCCPYLCEFRKLLLSNTSTCGNVKHITPLRALQSPTELTRKRLETQLEEAFFNGQPVSLRKTVEFVSERVASTCVKHVCNEIVPKHKQKALQEFRTKSTGDDDFKCAEFASECLEYLKTACEREISELVCVKIGTAIDALLPLDVLPQTKEACASIAVKMCAGRIEQWMKMHVVVDIFAKEFESEMQKAIRNRSKTVVKKTVFKLPEAGRDVSHDEETLSAVHLVQLLRTFSWKVLENPDGVNGNDLEGLLEATSKTLTTRCDVNDCILNVVNVMLVDLALLLVAHKTSLITSENILRQFCEIWRTYVNETGDLFKTLVCSRNVMLLAQSKDVRNSWMSFATMLTFLLEQQLMTFDNFEAQCVAFYRREWDKDTLGHVSACIARVVKWDEGRGRDKKFTLLLMDFLSKFCTDLL